MTAEILLRAFAENIAVIRVKDFRGPRWAREALVELEHHNGERMENWLAIGDAMSVSWTLSGRMKHDPSVALEIRKEES